MTTTSGTWTEEILELAGTKVQLVKGGSGKPLLVLHDEMGQQGLLEVVISSVASGGDSAGSPVAD